jgi:hypothetical protein
MERDGRQLFYHRTAAPEIRLLPYMPCLLLKKQGCLARPYADPAFEHPTKHSISKYILYNNQANATYAQHKQLLSLIKSIHHSSNTPIHHATPSGDPESYPRYADGFS